MVIFILLTFIFLYFVAKYVIFFKNGRCSLYDINVNFKHNPIQFGVSLLIFGVILYNLICFLWGGWRSFFCE